TQNRVCVCCLDKSTPSTRGESRGEAGTKQDRVYVVQCVTPEHSIDSRERVKGQQIGADELGGNAQPGGQFPCHLDRFRRDVDPDHVGASFGQKARRNALSTGKVENTSTGQRLETVDCVTGVSVQSGVILLQTFVHRSQTVAKEVDLTPLSLSGHHKLHRVHPHLRKLLGHDRLPTLCATLSSTNRPSNTGASTTAFTIRQDNR